MNSELYFMYNKSFYTADDIFNYDQQYHCYVTDSIGELDIGLPIIDSTDRLENDFQKILLRFNIDVINKNNNKYQKAITFSSSNNIDKKKKKKKFIKIETIESIKVKIPKRFNFDQERYRLFYIDAALLLLKQADVCELFSLTPSTFSRAFKESIGEIPELRHLVNRVEKKNLWPHRNGFDSEIIQYVLRKSEPIVIKIRNYNSKKSSTRSNNNKSINNNYNSK